MSSLTTSMMPTSTSTAPPPASTSADPNKDSQGPTSRPLLFFVALGFGVVFTNLWIIVGVKYCFRYNQRARAAMLAEQNGDIIDLGNMQRPRRRREKKLMSMDEVNERFPLTKYKVWRAGREQEGLPATGGITAPPSRAGSIKEHYGGLKRISTEDGAAGTNSALGVTQDGGHGNPESDTRDFATNNVNAVGNTITEGSEKRTEIPQIRIDGTNEQSTSPGTTAPTSTPGHSIPNTTSENRIVEDDDDPARTAIPDPVLESAQPGDACAICIESLDEDDEVRGLTCGHAFHASCIDPWLTSRRACCPLCKADYYVPKSRPEGDAATSGTEGANLPQQPPVTLQRPRLFLGGFLLGGAGRTGWPAGVGQRPARVPRYRPRTNVQPYTIPTAPASDAATTGNTETAQTPTRMSRFTTFVRSGPSRLPRFPRRGTDRQGQQPTEQTSTTPAVPEGPTTPGQLEAGTRT